MIIKLVYFCFFIVLLITSSVGFADEISEIDNFILTSTVAPYDCPEDDANLAIDRYLNIPGLSDTQRFQLMVMKTHWQICVGKHEEAKQALIELLNNADVNQTMEYYASATYQLGFIYDVQENLERCELYEKAEQLSNDNFEGINLSAQLGLITVCHADMDDGVKLGKMYALLETYALKNDQAALAHIHNNIGLLYASLGQQVLAAEQFQKSYELGLNTYTSSNLLATLMSVISSHMAAGNFEKAEQAIQEFKRVNLSVDTALSNVWLYFSEAGYHYRTNNIEQLRFSLAKWKIYLDSINSSTFNSLYRWYSAVVCYEDDDVECLQQFLVDEQNTSDGYKLFINRNKDYLKFIVQIHLFLGDIEGAEKAFDTFSDVMINKTVEQQESGKILGVANLHSQIQSLEASLQASKLERIQTIVIIVSVLLVIIVAIIFWLRHRYLNSLSFDTVTNLLNSKAALAKIRRVPEPSPGRTNALALFDLGNFRDVNRQIGATNSELALKQISLTLSQVTRDRDILGRFAPEQFIVCLTDIEEDSAKSFFERMRYALENTILGEQQGQQVSIRSSMSIYISSGTFVDLDEVLDDMLLSLGIQTESE
ncbi:diguanylate cyclase domain-containing protein [Aliiglaciecola sp. SL4]|uniref:diguanylate cyclase domain-containing protein n=1 Tax=Aliiglaciecola sp. SL4 TaxID=3239806 RepID=UPI00355B0EEF